MSYLSSSELVQRSAWESSLSSQRWRRLVILACIGWMIGLMIGLATAYPSWSKPYLDARLLSECERRGAEIAELGKRLGDLEKRADQHITEGKFFRERYTQVEQMVRELYYQPAARPDKFTGTDGKKLREELEAQIAALKAELQKRVQSYGP